ncbi:MAG: site-specific integrase [Anaerolineae bacterium]|nr:site-specific integrase [Anaerolineae bacterium]
MLRDEVEAQVRRADTPAQARDALLDRAAFYLLWQRGLRLGELEELDPSLSLGAGLAGRRLTVRKGKGMSDRTVYLTDTTVEAVRAYLRQRGLGPTDHLFLYRNEPLCKDLVRGRMQAAGERAGVKVYPHRLRHTCATQLLNAGCRVTSIQKFLGHKRLNSTMIYARVHDQTVADDYYAAMERVEQRLDIALQATLTGEASKGGPLNDKDRERLLDFADQLADPDLSPQARTELVEQMRQVLGHDAQPNEDEPAKQENGRRPRAPPQPSPAFPWVTTI